MKLSNASYDGLKFLATIALPATATLISAIGLIWNIPYTDQVVATLVAINTFIGALVGISSAKYSKEG